MQVESLSTVVRDRVFATRVFFIRGFLPEPFEDEVHPRLRFAYRGLVAMANGGTKNSNDSQFFITLGKFDVVLGCVGLMDAVLCTRPRG